MPREDRAATGFAQGVYADPAAKALYVATAKTLGRQPFRLAVADFLQGRPRVMPAGGQMPIVTVLRGDAPEASPDSSQPSRDHRVFAPRVLHAELGTCALAATPAIPGWRRQSAPRGNSARMTRITAELRRNGVATGCSALTRAWAGRRGTGCKGEECRHDAGSGAAHTTQPSRYRSRVSHFELPPLAKRLRVGSHRAFAP